MNHFLNQVITSPQILILIKISVAMCLGAFIGLERELKHKPVGVKTCVIISITTCILTIVSIQSAEYYAGVSDNIRTDPMRLAAQVISGIGFLGAGVILRKNNDAISGLTTAAIIWAAAGIGIATGAGFFFDAVIATLMILVAIRLSPYVMKLAHNRRPPEKEVEATFTLHLNSVQTISAVTALFKKNNCKIEDISIKDLYNGEINLILQCEIEESHELQNIYVLAKMQPGVLAVHMETT
ncbi:MgtC/SapB family protein [Pasteurella bettyae]|uniref:Protein MgtC n=1 Tax=Pasteurella bettyae CCUG 2042 TaxID=1095749 RepID=I3DBQ4_9PAST|nr:MgtC/SapB family protein [Pasteurella bettyae]EIJ69147.1 Mg2+ transporter-C, MgtC family [Pasteurella bettyae CCUG 2042]SUB22827.1 MgtC/SapB transporter family protein [Pasteurella bettyae]